MYGWLGRAITFISCHEIGFKVVSPPLALPLCGVRQASLRHNPMLGWAVLGPPGNTEVCQAMRITGWQLVLAHMLHLKGVMECTSLDCSL